MNRFPELGAFLPAHRAARRWLAVASFAVITSLLGGCAKPGSPGAATDSATPSMSAKDAAVAWLSYSTGVDPGSGIQFATPTFGWRVDGQFGAPHLDDQVAAGPQGTSFAWPGQGVSSTSDGGGTWQQLISDPYGIWGIDLLSAKTGWVVGVTQLSRTDDGGATWTPLTEPTGSHLVTVSFSSSTSGFGITTDGNVVQSSDGGASWSALAMKTPAVSICTDSSGVAYVSDGLGDILTSAGSQGGFQLAERSPVSGDNAANLSPYWSAMSCGGTTVWQQVSVLDPELQASSPYVVRVSTDGGTTWNAIAADSPDSSVAFPKAPAPFSALAGSGASQTGGYLVGFGDSGWGIRIASVDTAGDVTEDQSPSLQSGFAPDQTAGYVQVWGVASAGSTAWIFLNNSAAGTRDDPANQEVVYQTTDSGKTWSAVSTGSVETPPELSYSAAPPPDVVTTHAGATSGKQGRN